MRLTKEQNDVIKTFVGHLREDIAAAKSCGALPDDIHPVVLMKMVLPITADKMRLLSPQHQKMQRNLAKFI